MAAKLGNQVSATPHALVVRIANAQGIIDNLARGCKNWVTKLSVTPHGLVVRIASAQGIIGNFATYLGSCSRVLLGLSITCTPIEESISASFTSEQFSVRNLQEL